MSLTQFIYQPRKRAAIHGASADNLLRMEGSLAEHLAACSSRTARRHHSDPGVGTHKLQRPTVPMGWLGLPVLGSSGSSMGAGMLHEAGALSAALHAAPRQLGGRWSSSKRDRTSSEGGAGNCSCDAGPPVLDRAHSDRSLVLQRVQLLERRNKELEQQLLEQLQATQISQPHHAATKQQPAGAAATSSADGGPVLSPCASSEATTMEIEADCRSRSCAMNSARVIIIDCQAQPQPGLHSHARQQAQQQPPSQQPPSQQPPSQQPQPQGGQQEAKQGQPALQVAAQQACPAHEGAVEARPGGGQQEVARLRREVNRLQQLNTMLQSDNADLEMVLKETEKQRREFAARYAFMTLDTDGDGYVSVEQVQAYDLFSCYAPALLRGVFALWRWGSGFPGYLCMEDFVRFVEYSEDRGSPEAQRFWFSVMDADGDGRLSWADMRTLYDGVDKSLAGGGMVSFPDLMDQVRDMVGMQADPAAGFTLQELLASKLGGGVIGLLTNANNMLLQRSTAEWGRGDFPL